MFSTIASATSPYSAQTIATKNKRLYHKPLVFQGHKTSENKAEPTTGQYTRRRALKALAALGGAAGFSWLGWTGGTAISALRSPTPVIGGLSMATSVFGVLMPKDFVVGQTYLNAPEDEKAIEIQKNAFKDIGNVQRFVVQVNQAQLQGWYVPPKAKAPTAVFVAGADGDFTKYSPLMKMLADSGYGIFTYQYRGYGIVKTETDRIISGSSGEPTEEDLYNDFKALSTQLNTGLRARKIDVNGNNAGTLSIPATHFNQQILIGKSMGADMCVRLAAESDPKRYKALVLITIPISMQAAMRNLSLYETIGPVRFYARVHDFFLRGNHSALKKLGNMFDVWDKVDKLRVPTLFIQAEQDALAHKSDTQKLFNKCKASNPNAGYIELSGRDHNNTFDRAESVEQIRTELLKLAPA